MLVLPYSYPGLFFSLPFRMKLKEAARAEPLCKSEVKSFFPTTLWVPMMGLCFVLSRHYLKRKKNMAENPQKLAAGFRCPSNNQSIFFTAFGLHGLVMETTVYF